MLLLFVAVNVTEVPGQIGFMLAAMLTAAVIAVPLTLMVIVLELAGDPLTHPVDELIAQVT